MHTYEVGYTRVAKLAAPVQEGQAAAGVGAANKAAAGQNAGQLRNRQADMDEPDDNAAIPQP